MLFMAWLSREEFERRKARGYPVVEPIGGSPARLSMASWRARIGNLKAVGASEADPRVAECRSALAFWRVAKQLQDDRGALSPEGIEALILELEQPGSAAAVVDTTGSVQR